MQESYVRKHPVMAILWTRVREVGNRALQQQGKRRTVKSAIMPSHRDRLAVRVRDARRPVHPDQRLADASPFGIGHPTQEPFLEVG
jgi:hypothetical protein